MTKIIICSQEAPLVKGVIINQHGGVRLGSGMETSIDELGIVARSAVLSAQRKDVRGLLVALDEPEKVISYARKLTADIVSGRRKL